MGIATNIRSKLTMPWAWWWFDYRRDFQVTPTDCLIIITTVLKFTRRGIWLFGNTELLIDASWRKQATTPWYFDSKSAMPNTSWPSICRTSKSAPARTPEISTEDKWSLASVIVVLNDDLPISSLAKSVSKKLAMNCVLNDIVYDVPNLRHCNWWFIHVPWSNTREEILTPIFILPDRIRCRKVGTHITYQ